jgi:phospholipid N-methyltransferase
MKDPTAGRSLSDRTGSGSQRTTARLLRGLELHLKERVEFLRVFIKEPTRVGALSPSSPALARALVHGLALKTANTVIEIGPGTGAVTGLILKRIGKATTFFALELNSRYTRSLKRRFPDLIVHNDSAEKLGKYLSEHGRESAKYIISGLPWAFFDSALQERILHAVHTSLAPDGVFTTFAYVHALWMPAARKFRRRLESGFSRVEASPVVWRNLPPAFVYRCSRVRHRS